MKVSRVFKRYKNLKASVTVEDLAGSTKTGNDTRSKIIKNRMRIKRTSAHRAHLQLTDWRKPRASD